jgi:poly(hydroxyalkanoate) granule-associated protein
MTTPATPEYENDPLAQPIDNAAASAHTAIDRAAATSSSLVDRAAEAAKQAERTAREQGRAALGVGQDVVRAGLGAVGAAGEQTAKLFHALVDRGARVEDKVVGQVRETVETVREKVGDLRGGADARQQQVTTRMTETVGGVIDSTVAEPLAGAMRRVGVPTRAEVRELAAALTALSAKVDALVARLDAAGGPAADADPVIVRRHDGAAAHAVPVHVGPPRGLPPR